ncbi:MAG: (d)CMP kinase [Candidatus Gygaella obscura]|nr:(d)CMP kinase [Candidatus Gygaella obscura]
MIIAIDGPAGSGKSTVARLLARKLQFLYIDTGAMYRAITLVVLESNTDVNNEQSIARFAYESKIKLINQEDGSIKIFLNEKDVSFQIRQPQITSVVSDISRIQGVREAMLKLQRELGNSNNSVLEGRDIGTVVFPHAEVKFFLDADFKERVRRRFEENNQKNIDTTFSQVEADLANRDRIDSTRKIAPLKKAEDAVMIDTTFLSIDQAVDKLYSLVKNKS